MTKNREELVSFTAKADSPNRPLEFTLAFKTFNSDKVTMYFHNIKETKVETSVIVGEETCP